ncbi:hypothetical protein FJZ18_04100 [Candidatus Pacearchaeota archaeon]|nr:hypothetical protein [Candidatus Pacearchaeota archaeon]
MKKSLNILFICKYNRFRSRIAEAYFNKINKNPKIKAKSAGIIRGSTLDSTQVRVCKEEGLNISGYPKGMSTTLLKWQEIIIVVADDVPPSLFEDNKKYGKKLLIWKIPDSKTNSEEEIRGIVQSIKTNIESYLERVK